MIPAYQLASRPDAFGKTLTRPSRSDLGRFYHNMIHFFFGKTELNRMREVGSAYTTRPDSGCTLAVMAISGHNQNASWSDQACLLGQYHPPCSTISLPSTVQYNQHTIHRAVQSAYHPPCSTISLSLTVQYNQPITHRAVQSAYHSPCSTISLPSTVQYNQPTIHRAVQSAYHPHPPYWSYFTVGIRLTGPNNMSQAAWTAWIDR